jgi:hypothetical protein
MEELAVVDALAAAGYMVERTTHKQGTNQSHGRWEVRGDGFEVHPGYHNNKSPPAPLVDTIVQGTKGWKVANLDAVALSLEKAHLRCSSGVSAVAAQLVSAVADSPQPKPKRVAKWVVAMKAKQSQPKQQPITNQPQLSTEEQKKRATANRVRKEARKVNNNARNAAQC